MKRQDVEKLLGGYAAGILTAEEMETLFAAALEDQDLFDRLAREEALRETLADPASRARLLDALDRAGTPWHVRAARWFGRPAGLGALAGATAAAVAMVAWLGYRAPAPPAVEMAQVRAPRQEAAAPPAPAPAAAQAPTPTRPAPKKEAAPPPPPARQESVGVVGGVPGGMPSEPVGGVIGGIIGAAPSAPPPPAKGSAPPPSFEPVTVASQAPPAVRGADVARDSAKEEKNVLSAAPAPVAQAEKARERPRLAKPAASARFAAAPAAAGWRVLRRGRDGAFTQVEPGAVFTQGDRVRLALQAAQTGWVYVLERESGGGWRLLAGERVERGSVLEMPREGALALERSGVRQIYAVYTSSPDEGLARLVPDAIAARLPGATALSLEIR